MKRYEAMFLFDNAALHQWSDMEAEVRRLCGRIEAQLQVCLKFDERKLAYEIQGRKRGTYVLTYFDASPERITDLERDVQLSEVILRILVLRNDSVSEQRLTELKALPADQPLQPFSGDSRRDGGPYRHHSEGRSDYRRGDAPVTEKRPAVQRQTEPAPETARAAATQDPSGVEPPPAPQVVRPAPGDTETREGQPASE